MARELGFGNTESYINELMSRSLTKKQIEMLARRLTVGETYFFRHPDAFDILKKHILPKLIDSRRGSDQRLRIWSAGCASGEEPYSLAILLSELIPDLNNWDVDLVATDINPRVLQKASAGVYTEWSFRGTPLWTRYRYFTKTKEGYEILPEIKKMVRFTYHNLAQEFYLPPWDDASASDIIFCRNVLVYFAPHQTRNIIQNFHRSLVDGGWLIVGPSEASAAASSSKFVTVHYPGCALFRKDGKKARTVEHHRLILPLHDSIRNEKPAPSERPGDFVPERSSEGALPEEFRKPLPLEADRPETPEPRRPRYEEALELYEQGRYAEAGTKIVELLSHDPENSETMILLSRVYGDQGNLAEPRVWCQRATAANPLNWEGHFLLATIFQAQDQVEKAKVSLERVLYLDQDVILAHFELGNLTRKQGKKKQSDRHFSNALSLLSTLFHHDDTVPGSDGITAGRLMQIIGDISEAPIV